MKNDFTQPQRPQSTQRSLRVPPRQLGVLPPAEETKQSADPPAPELSAATVRPSVSNTTQKPDTYTDIPLESIDMAESPPGKKSPKQFVIFALIALCIAVICAGIAGCIWYSSSLSAVNPKDDNKIAVTVPEGSGSSAIAALLKQNGLIKNDDAFKLYVRLNNKAASLQSGSYRLSKSEDVPRIVSHLTSGKTDTFSITFLPGDTLAKHRTRLIAAGYDAETVDTALAKTYSGALFEGKPDSADLEGYIYGETYQFPANATVEEILQRTFDEYESNIEKNAITQAVKQRGYTLYQAITLASVIQREVVTKDDMAQVSQVFQKRLSMNMPLGSDVTYQYIADKTGQVRDVNLDSPYNTRRYPGLPPGPIASPGIDALKAVGAPAPGDYLYFLSGDDDKTYYGRTNEEHEQNIQNHCAKKCQII